MVWFRKVAIIGPGLIGGSVGLALKNKFRNRVSITAFGRNEGRIKLAKKIGAVDNYCMDICSAVKDKDLVVVCTPVEKIAEMIQLISPYLSKKTIVTDAGSVKKFVIDRIKKIKSENLNFIGSHPIAGSEKKGVEYADKNLFDGSACVVCFDKKLSDKESLNKICIFWESVGCKIFLLDADEHDKILAATSHFLHILSYLIFDQIATRKKFLGFVGGAFRDMTRIASSSGSLWSEICNFNKKNIKREILLYRKRLEKVCELLDNKGDLEKYFSYISKRKNEYDKIIQKK